jgi:hypothetical protein
VVTEKSLHQSTEEQNFVSDQNISGKTFRSDLSVADNDCEWSHVQVLLLLLLLLLQLLP